MKHGRDETPDLGPGTHYTGERGAEYFQYQRKAGEIGGVLDRWKFEPFIRTSDAVVDFGCGMGAMLDALDARSKIGVEVNPAARDAARRRGVEVVGSVSDLSDASADVIISNHVLELH